MMLNHLFYWLFLIFLVGCDLPPDDIIDGETTSDFSSSDSEILDSATMDTETEDSETEEDSDEDTETEETDSEDTESSCLEAMICIATTPTDMLGCLSGMASEDAKAARELAFCVLADCADSMDEVVALGICLMSSCSDEAISCVGSSFF